MVKEHEIERALCKAIEESVHNVINEEKLEKIVEQAIEKAAPVIAKEFHQAFISSAQTAAGKAALGWLFKVAFGAGLILAGRVWAKYG